ncbi:MAG: hypothetical protein ABR946_11585 [Solirubrobacteraceae bacterium]
MTAETEQDTAEVAESPPPPVGEEIHLPGPSILPLLLAVGITCALVGVTVSIILVVLGLAITIPAIVLWIRTTLADIAELPPSHHH